MKPASEVNAYNNGRACSRINYLVRKNIVEAAGKGLFISTLGWGEEGEA